MRGLKERGPFVSEVSRGKVRIEQGEPAGVAARGRIALITQFSMGPDQPMSLSKCLETLEGNGCAAIIISTCDSAEPLRFPHRIPEAAVVMRYPNLGYDFGSWITALGCVPDICEVPVVLLANDSLPGPFTPTDHLLEWAVKPGPDIRGLTVSYQFARHIQSLFLVFRGGILADRSRIDSFNDVRVEPDKDDVVLSYEPDASKMCFPEAYSFNEWVTDPDFGVPCGSPTVGGWRKLMEYNVPSLERTTMTHPSALSEGTGAAAYIARRHNTDIAQW